MNFYIKRSLEKRLVKLEKEPIANKLFIQFLNVLLEDKKTTHEKTELSPAENTLSKLLVELEKIVASTDSSDSEIREAAFLLGIYYRIMDSKIPEIMNKIVSYFLLASDKGDDRASTFLAYFYTTGQYVTRDRVVGTNYFQLGAERGDPDAQFRLGVCYEFGNEVEMDLKRAAELYALSADQNECSAIFKLGLFYLRGRGVIKDEKRAVELFTLAYKHENGFSCNVDIELANCYFNGIGVPENRMYAAQLYHEFRLQNIKIPALDNLAYCNNMGLCYEQGIGSPKDHSMAFEFYLTAFNGVHQFYAFDETNAISMEDRSVLDLEEVDKQCHVTLRHFARCFEKGIGTKRNWNRSQSLYKIADCKEMSEKLFLMANYLVEFPELNSPSRTNTRGIEIVRYIERAAKLGHETSRFMLGLFYEYAFYVRSDAKLAAEILDKITREQLVQAQYETAMFFKFRANWEQSTITEKDIYFKTAARLFKLSAYRGHTLAQFEYGCCRRYGRGVERDDADAEDLFSVAAENRNNAEVQLKLGLQLYNGNNTNEALTFIEIAADLGHVEAQYHFSKIFKSDFFHANHQKFNFDKVNLFLELAALKGHPAAMCEWGNMLEGDNKMPQAIEFYQRAVDKSEPDAYYRLAECCKEGNGVNQDIQQAIKYYEMAIEKDHLDAMWALGQCYETGMGVAKNASRAAYYYQKILDNYRPDKSIQGLYNQRLNLIKSTKMHLGKFYWHGIGVIKNKEKAANLFTQFEIDTSKTASDNLYVAFCYEHGVGIDSDREMAQKFYMYSPRTWNDGLEVTIEVCFPQLNITTYSEALLALERVWHVTELNKKELVPDKNVELDALFCATLFHRLGTSINDGFNIHHNWFKHDKRRATELFEVTARFGYAPEQYELGLCYENGIGVEVDIRRADLLFQAACEQGYKNAREAFETLRRKNHNQKVNFITLKLVKEVLSQYQAMTASEKAKVSNTELSLFGFCYEFGLGIPVDLRKAAELYKQAIEAHVYCHWDLFVCYRALYAMGLINLDKLLKLYKDLDVLAKEGHGESAVILGYLHEIGAPELQQSFITAMSKYEHAKSNRNPNYVNEIVGRKNLQFLPLRELHQALDKAVEESQGVLSFDSATTGIIAEYANVPAHARKGS